MIAHLLRCSMQTLNVIWKGQLKGVGQIIKYPVYKYNGTLTLSYRRGSRDRPEGFKQESDMITNFRKMTLEAGTQMDLRKKRQQ